MAWVKLIVREIARAIYIQFPYADPAQVTPLPHRPSELTFKVAVGALGLEEVGVAVGLRQAKVPVGARIVKVYSGTSPEPARYQFSGGSPKHCPTVTDLYPWLKSDSRI